MKTIRYIKIIGILLLTCLSSSVYADTTNQDDKAFENNNPIYRNVYGELFGATDGIGISYDQRFRAGSKWGFRAGMGVGFLGFDGWADIPHRYSISFQVGVNGIFGKKCNFFETGLSYGPVLAITNASMYTDNDKIHTGYYSKISIDLGYRYQRPNGLMLRLGISPMLTGQPPYYLFMVFPYLSAGYTF